MSILIRGMEMPIFEHQSWDIHKGTDGKWYMVDNNAETSDGAWHEIVPVPPHGDLIDKKTVSENLASVLNKKNPPFSYPDWSDAIVAMLTAPTIIPAEEGET